MMENKKLEDWLRSRQGFLWTHEDTEHVLKEYRAMLQTAINYRDRMYQCLEEKRLL